MSAVETTRSFIDYSLARRALLAALFGGRATATDVCDAHPYLLRAAKFHGEPTSEQCPVCRKEPLTHVTYTYGDALGQYSGRIKATRPARGSLLADFAASPRSTTARGCFDRYAVDGGTSPAHASWRSAACRSIFCASSRACRPR